MIINDMKGELYKSNQKTRLLQSRGYLVYFINLQNPEEGDGYNPLESIINAWESGNPTFAEELTLSFAWQIFDPDSATGNEKYFAETGAAVTEALILAHAIVRNEYNQYFYLYGKPNEVELGTVIENKYLKPIDDLMLMEQKEIKSIIGTLKLKSNKSLEKTLQMKL